MKALRLGRGGTTLAVLAGALGLAVVNPTPAFASCQWKVVWPTASVYAWHSTQSAWLKTKQLGDYVGPYCSDRKVWNATEGYWFTPVNCTCASSGVGWMRSAALNPA